MLAEGVWAEAEPGGEGDELQGEEDLDDGAEAGDVARGVPLGEIEAILNVSRESEERLPSSPTRRMANSRRTAMVLISVGVGVVLLGVALTAILRDREVLSVAAAGLVPLCIGSGFLGDYSLQRREIERLGMGLEEDVRGL